LTTDNSYPLRNPNGWTYIGTIGCFASSFLFVTEWLGQYAELTAKTLGYSIKNSYRFFGYKEIGGIPATYYAIGFSIALIATLGFCYAVFFQFLHYQEKSPQKTYKQSTAKKIISFIDRKNSTVQKIMNFIALFGSFMIPSLWISGASLSIFLFPVKFSITSKNIITYALILLGILACISYVRMYKQTLPGHIQAENIDNKTLAKYASMILVILYNQTLPNNSENQEKPEINNTILAKYASMILNTLYNQTRLGYQKTLKIDKKILENNESIISNRIDNKIYPDDAKKLDEGPLNADISRILEILDNEKSPSKVQDQKPLKTDGKTLETYASNIFKIMSNSKEFEEQKMSRFEKNLLEYTSMAIFSLICFFSNSYFMAYMLQFYIISSFHTILWCDISLYAWVFGTIIGLFFTVSAVYCYSRMYSEKPLIEINGIIIKAEELTQFNTLADLNELNPIKKKTQKLSRLKKMLLKSALLGLIGVTILDTFYPISISLRYICQNSEKNLAFVGICLAALVLSCLCTVGPYNTIKQSVEAYNNAKISLGFSF